MAAAQGASRHHECALCIETFTSPRLLPCFHTFCLGCLQRLVQTQPSSRTFSCPTCRSTIPIPEGGVGKFQVNFYIEAEVEGKDGRPTVCELCQKNSASHKCTDCDQFACDACTAVHASIAATKSHTILQLKNLKVVKGSGRSHVQIIKERYCATHRAEKIRFFCSQCSTIICRDCKLVSHEGHATIDLSVKASEAKQLTEQVTKASGEKLKPKLRQRLQEACDHQKHVRGKKKKLQALLERRAAELKQEIDKGLSQAKQQLDQEAKNADRTVAECIESMETALAGFLSVTEHAERVAQGGCEADILEMPGVLRQFFEGNVEELSQQPGSSGPCFSAPQPSKKKLNRAKNRMRMDGSKGKLKAFTGCEWKVDLHMEDDRIKCSNCSFQYDRKLSHCPSCRRASMQSGRNRIYANYAGNKQCHNCRNVYAQNYQYCPSCSATESDDVKATIQKAIPAYIGRVVRSRAQDEENTDPYNEYGCYDDSEYESSDDEWATGYPRQPASNTKSSKSNQIISEISAIQSCLCQW